MSDILVMKKDSSWEITIGNKSKKSNINFLTKKIYNVKGVTKMLGKLHYENTRYENSIKLLNTIYKWNICIFVVIAIKTKFTTRCTCIIIDISNSNIDYNQHLCNSYLYSYI